MTSTEIQTESSGTAEGLIQRFGDESRRGRRRLGRLTTWITISLASGMLFPQLVLGGSVSDSDADLVPDAFDNCLILANGPRESCNQTDVDLDGYGNNCDADVDQDFATTTLDFSRFLAEFTILPAFPTMDLNCDGRVNTLDFAIFLSAFQSGAGPGPSGLPCAGTAPCVP